MSFAKQTTSQNHIFLFLCVPTKKLLMNLYYYIIINLYLHVYLLSYLFIEMLLTISSSVN